MPQPVDIQNTAAFSPTFLSGVKRHYFPNTKEMFTPGSTPEDIGNSEKLVSGQTLGMEFEPGYILCETPGILIQNFLSSGT